MTFMGAIKLDGKTVYEWHAHTSTLDSTIIVDDMCVPKILHRRLNDSPLLSAVYFNSIPHANVSAVARFDKTGCLKAM